MGVSFSGKKIESAKMNKQEESLLPEFPTTSQPSTLLAVIKKSIGLKFSNGYEFTIFYENGKMIISATINGQEAFYLDEIPEEFIDSLRRMLG